MNISELLGQTVSHVKFGPGVITEADSQFFYVDFNGTVKKFSQQVINLGLIKFSNDSFQKQADEDFRAKQEEIQKAEEEKSKVRKIIGFWKPKQANGYLGNWYPAPFTMDGHQFTDSEQAFMYKKALLFNDTEHAEKILASKSPLVSKRLGRYVKPFDPAVFDQHKFQFMVDVCFEKFSQNELLKNRLLSTGDALLVEASGVDKIWGIGMTVDDPNFNDPTKWRGQNLLGKALMEVREKLKSASNT